MSTPDQPSTPPLTRRQMRDLRNTGSTPVIPAEPAETVEEVQEQAPPSVPLPRPAEPAPVAPAPRADASVDLGVSPLTRRQAREQERIRTASVPVISPDMAESDASSRFTPPAAAEPAERTPLQTAEQALAPADEPATETPSGEAPTTDTATNDTPSLADDGADRAEDAPAPLTVSDRLGSALLEGEPVAVDLPPSFDQLLTRGTATTGAVATPNALILSQTPSAPPLVGPVTATGEVILTGSFELPEGLGSRGHADGTTDGADIDAVLVDGELPPASSPVPVAASAAISTVKTADEIIRPPAPEKGSKLMLGLIITTGVLAAAIVGLIVVAVTTGLLA